MSPICTLLAEMRGRLAMYVGETSLTKLAAFLRGYDYALEKVGRKSDPFLPDFRDWIHRHFQTATHSWEDTILLHSADQEAAVEHFWRLLDQYQGETDGCTPAPSAPEVGEEVDWRKVGL
jgi:hypothetical protein